MKRQNVKFPTRPEKPVKIPSLGGEFLARSMSLADRVSLRDVESEEMFAPRLLALTILDEDAKPVGTFDQWADFILAHQDEALEVLKLCNEVNGFTVEKKT